MRLDLLSVTGIVLAFVALIGGNLLDGGNMSMLLNGPAALIVIGGTVGAAVLQTPKYHLKRALKLFPWVFSPPPIHFQGGINKVVSWAKTARREGLLGLEDVANREKDRFLKKGLELLVDGSEPEIIRHVLETDIQIAEQRDADATRFFECMGGYAPTIGIIGAVLGLIHVMQHLTDPSALGPGIAVAFVATIYGVASANFLFIPIANKLHSCIRSRSLYHELIVEGIIAIADGENPKNIQYKLSGYVSVN